MYDQPFTVNWRAVVRAVSGALALVAVVAVAWLILTGLLARSQLNSVKSELPRLRQALSAGNFDQARSISQDLAVHAHRAHALSTGPAWWVASNIPFFGTPLDTSRTIAAQSDRVGADALPGVLKLADSLTGDQLRQGDSINLAPIVAAEPVLQSSSAAANSAAAAIRSAPKSTWLPYVNSARTEFAHDLDELDGELAGASRTVQTLLPMLGQSGLQRYFIGFENEAEARGLGGLPGAFAIVTADHGAITFTHFENDTALNKISVDLNFGADFANRYAVDDPTGTYVNSDISPNFPYAAQIWAAMWQKKSGEHVDGAIAIDPTALSYLLKVTGPAALPDGSTVNADNVVALTQQREYSLFANVAQRKAYLVGVSKAISKQLVNGSGKTVDLVRAVAKAAQQRRFVVWTANPTTEAAIAASGYGGVVQGGSGPFSGFVVVNAAGTKLDYYLDRSMTYTRSGCGPGSTAVATFALTNNAPRTGLPTYVTNRADADPPADVQPGDNRLLVTYYASAGASVRSVSIDGKPLTVASAAENGLVTVSVDVELPVGATRTMTVTLTEPPAQTGVEILQQPLVRPMTVHVSGSTCR
jgi:hypothetical protein